MATRFIVIESGSSGEDGYAMKYNKAHGGAVRNIVIQSPANVSSTVDFVMPKKSSKGGCVNELAGAFIREYRQQLQHQLEGTE